MHVCSLSGHLPVFGVAGVALVGLVAVGRQRCRATLHGRRGTWRHLLSRGWRGTWRILETSTCVWRGRRGTWRHLPAFGVAGVALVALGVALGRRWSPLVAPGAAPLCVAGVALGDIHLRSAWQVWHLETSTCVCVAIVVLVRFTSQSCTWRHLPSVHVAGVAHGDIYLRLAWQAWHLETSTCVWCVRCSTFCTWWRAWSPLVARGAAPLCVAGVALGDIHPDFAWQALHLSHLPAFGVAGVAHWRGRRGNFVISYTIFLTPTHSHFHTPSHSHNFVTHHLSHTQLCHRPSFSQHHLSHAISLTQLCHTPSLSHTTLSHTIFLTSSQSHNFVTHHFSHTIFHTPLCHPPSLTHHLSHTTLSHTIFHHTIFHTQLCHTHHLSVSHTISSFTYNFVTHTHNFVLLLDPPPPPLSFLPSPSPLQHMVLIIGRSCLVGLSGPLILVPGCWKCLIYHFGLIMLER